jgi:hypothetical protein
MQRMDTTLDRIASPALLLPALLRRFDTPCPRDTCCATFGVQDFDFALQHAVHRQPWPDRFSRIV